MAGDTRKLFNQSCGVNRFTISSHQWPLLFLIHTILGKNTGREDIRVTRVINSVNSWACLLANCFLRTALVFFFYIQSFCLWTFACASLPY